MTYHPRLGRIDAINATPWPNPSPDRIMTVARTTRTPARNTLVALFAAVAVWILATQRLPAADESSFVPVADWERRILRSRIILRPADARLLRLARSQVLDGQTRLAALTLQKLLDAGDSFILSSDGTSIQNARRLAIDLIQSNAKLVADYEAAFGAMAAGLFQQAVERSDELQLRRVVRRFRLTPAGFKAAHRLAVLHFDRGEFETAYQLLSRLLRQSIHRNRVSSNARLRLALCSAFTGRADLARKQLAALGEKNVRIAGRDVQAKSRFGSERASKLRRTSLGSIGGTPQMSSDTNPIPYLRPLWTRQLNDSPLVSRTIDQWERNRRFSHPQRSVAVASFPVFAGDALSAADLASMARRNPTTVSNPQAAARLAGGVVIVRDQERLRAIDVQSGETAWSFKLTSSPREAIESHMQNGGTVSDLLERRGLLWNALLGMPAADRRRVYFIDGFSFAERNDSAFNVIKSPPTLVDSKRSYVMPSANRLAAIDLSAAARALEGEAKLLWSTAGPQDSMEWFDQLDQQSDGVLVPNEMLDSIHDFSFYDTNSDGRIEREEARQSLRKHGHAGPLAGHFFLGPPLPVDGRLYVATERDGEINAVALDAESGRVLWVQPVAQTNHKIEADVLRATHPCVPAYVDGMIVLPTQLGVLVAVDAVDGSLVWASPVPDQGPYAGMTNVPGFWATEHEQATPSVIHNHGDRLIWMPPFSKWLYCLDMRTGRRWWKAERDGDEQVAGGANRDKFVGTVADNVVMIVGSQASRGVSLETGERLWNSQTGMPTGRGLAFGNPFRTNSDSDHTDVCYLLPLQAGVALTLNVRTGRTIAKSGHDNQHRPSPLEELTASLPNVFGNLLATDSHIISVGPRTISAHPRASELRQMATHRRDLGPMPIGNVMLVGELSAALGDDLDAVRHFRAVLRTTRDASTEARLRGLLFARAESDLGAETLASLRPVCHTIHDRIRLLTLEAEAALRDGNTDALQDVVTGIRQLDIRQPIAFGDNPAHRMSVGTWVQQLWRRSRSAFKTPASLQVQDRLSQRIEDCTSSISGRTSSTDHRMLRTLISDFADWPVVEKARLQLALHAANIGDYHEAELLLSRCRDSTDHDVKTTATLRLARLWDRLGLHVEAAGLLANLVAPTAARPVTKTDSASTVTHQVDAPKNLLDGLHSLTLNQLRDSAVNWDLIRSRFQISIQPELWLRDDPRVIESYSGYRGRYRLPWGNTFRLLDKGTDSASRFEIIDRQSGMAVNHINIPVRRSLPSVSRGAHVGHFFAIGAMGRVVGVSLLDPERHEPVWSREFLDLPGPARLVMTGPAGPRFCTVQTQGTLAVLDPTDGRLLWQRDDLTIATGLIGDPTIGIFGDERVLVVLDGDGRGYTTYRTADGELLARGQLATKPRTPRFKLGRRFFYVTETPTGDAYRLWDPLTNKFDIDEPAFQPMDGRYLATTTPGGEVAYVAAGGQLKIYNANEERQVIAFELADCEMPTSKAINGLRVFLHADNYIVNLQSTNNVISRDVSTYYSTNNFIPSMHVQGELLALNAKTGRRAWRQSVPCLSVLNPRYLRLPFLIAFSRVSDQTEPGKTRQSTTVTAIDPGTGEVLSRKTGLFPDRILHFSFERMQRRIEFHGIHGRIHITY